MITYRLARPADAAAIAELHADSWRRSFRGQMSDRYLDHEVVADRAAVWQRRMHQPDPETTTVTIVAEAHGELRGFVHAVAAEDPVWGTLLDNLHVRHDTRRQGVGTRLLTETARWLQQHGYTGSMYLWVLEANHLAQRLYSRLGGHPATREIVPVADGSPVASVRYCWPQLAVLIRHLPQSRHPRR
jgi:GNAT superfamily N-acetyltransferase